MLITNDELFIIPGLVEMIGDCLGEIFSNFFLIVAYATDSCTLIIINIIYKTYTYGLSTVPFLAELLCAICVGLLQFTIKFSVGLFFAQDSLENSSVIWQGLTNCANIE